MNQIYCFWTGQNEMSDNRKRCLEQLRRISECEVILITPSNLQDYLLPNVPLHPAYPYLSETHKADYLRTYFMHFHGNGYSDIKQTTGSWVHSFEELARSEEKWIIGYQEIEGGVAYDPVKQDWKSLIGNCSYICKPKTSFTYEWYHSMLELLDEKLEQLKQFPATHPQDYLGYQGSRYPLEWNEMLGRIFHRICYSYRDYLLQTLPTPNFESYR